MVWASVEKSLTSGELVNEEHLQTWDLSLLLPSSVIDLDSQESQDCEGWLQMMKGKECLFATREALVGPFGSRGEMEE